jgi:periplasmic protein TonB
MKRSLLYVFLLTVIAFIPLSFSQKVETKKIKLNSKTMNIKIVEAKLKEKTKEVKKVVKPKIKPKPKKKIIKKIKKPKPKKKIKKIEPPKPVVEKVEEEVIKEEVVQKEPVQKELKRSTQQDVKKVDAYYTSIYDTINRKKYYPKKSRRFKQEDSIPVYFIIDKDGFVSGFKIIKRSRYEALNKAVEKIFKKIKQFQKPPKSIETPLEMKISINFTMKEV